MWRRRVVIYHKLGALLFFDSEQIHIHISLLYTSCWHLETNVTKEPNLVPVTCSDDGGRLGKGSKGGTVVSTEWLLHIKPYPGCIWHIFFLLFFFICRLSWQPLLSFCNEQGWRGNHFHRNAYFMQESERRKADTDRNLSERCVLPLCATSAVQTVAQDCQATAFKQFSRKYSLRGSKRVLKWSEAWGGAEICSCLQFPPEFLIDNGGREMIQFGGQTFK